MNSTKQHKRQIALVKNYKKDRLVKLVLPLAEARMGRELAHYLQ
jgi:hypothetical protein